MATKTTISSLLIGAAGFGFGLVSAFFCYYTARLLYINVTGAVAVRNSGMLIGAVAFPLIAIVFGWLSLRCIRFARR